ncbi:hypothetical protein Tsp_12032 [Trichinella spiralis]|uniref:hypothetical protein n=1 Tax=Trichinella spiralis TaxID=6334 RepID=UPI0001EFB691|nr:hypothetical protein Tsp_12032 [Trichinella spiralis]
MALFQRRLGARFIARSTISVVSGGRPGDICCWKWKISHRMLNASIALYFSGVERDPKFFKSFLFNIISWLYRWKFVVIILNCKFLLGSSSLKTASAWLQNLAPMEIVFENCVKLDLGLWKLAIQKIQICATAAQLLQWLYLFDERSRRISVEFEKQTSCVSARLDFLPCLHIWDKIVQYTYVRWGRVIKCCFSAAQISIVGVKIANEFK